MNFQPGSHEIDVREQIAVTQGAFLVLENTAVAAASLRLIRAAKPRRGGKRKDEKRRGGRRRRGRGTEDPYYTPDEGFEETIEAAMDRHMDALVTRNHYGCLVLNAAHALFIDVDTFVPDEIYNPLDGRDDRLEPVRHQVLSDLCKVLASEDAYGFRIYRTSGGFRILATNQQFEPGSEPAERLMNSVGADRDFVELCRRQNNFRARLSPKPWRCGLHRPPNTFPRKSIRAEARFQKWLVEYDRACGSRATCEYVGHVGRDQIHERIGPVIEFHDRATNALSSLPLA